MAFISSWYWHSDTYWAFRSFPNC